MASKLEIAVKEVMETLESGMEKFKKEMEEKLESLLTKQKRKPEIGDTFALAGLQWKVLDITEKGYVCLSNEKYGSSRPFDSSCNDWKTSDLRNELNTEFYKKLVEEIGEDNIIEFERDLLSMDGQTEYGTCMDKVSLINVDEYRKYRSLIENTEDYWWWTLTPDSTKCNKDTKWIRVVSPAGDINFNICCIISHGVRPFCIFSSAIFESEGE